MPQSINPLLYRLAPQYGLDPDALQAVARGEGGLVNREGDIGDLSGGGSYGPFQLYTKGALPARFRGKPRAADQWAWSPEGIKYALGRMQAAGASGLRGGAAVNRIIRHFERPAAPDKSVAAALARLGSGGGPLVNAQGATPAQSAAPATQPRVSRRDTILQALIRGDDPNELIQSLPGMREASSPVAPRMATGTPTPGLPPGQGTAKGIRELIYGNRAVFDGTPVSYGKGDHDRHIHYAPQSAQQMLQAISLAQKLGLSVRENPYTDPVDPVHTKNSHHYQQFPGLFSGRRLGRAADISGNAQALKTLYARLAGL